MTSYQKLKERNSALQAEIQKMLDNPEYYISMSLANKFKKGINEAILFGKPFMIHKPNGKLRFSGLIKKLTSEK